METIRGDWNRQREKSRELKVYYAATNPQKWGNSSRALLCHLDSQQRELHSAKGYLRLKVSSFFTVY